MISASSALLFVIQVIIIYRDEKIKTGGEQVTEVTGKDSTQRRHLDG